MSLLALSLACSALAGIGFAIGWIERGRWDAIERRESQAQIEALRAEVESAKDFSDGW